MNQLRIRILGCTCAAALAVAGINGCARTDADSYLASASSYIAKSDYKAAIIEIKNALQEAPDNAQARLLLGRSLLAVGDAVGAEAEVRKAIDLHAPDDETYPLLARALVARGQFRKVISEAGTRKLASPAARADLGVSLSNAYRAEGDVARATALLDAALAEKPDDVLALVLKAQLAAQGGDLVAARKFAASALTSSPNNAAALVTSAEIEFAAGNGDEAQRVLEHGVDAQPGSIEPRFALVAIAVRRGRLDVAKAQVAKMKEIAASDSRTLYADALLAYAENDNARARDQIQKVLAGSPDHLPSMLLAGLVNFRLGSYAVAEDLLRKVVARVPDDSSAARVLAGFYLGTGRANEAIETLQPALARAPDDPLLLRAVGEAYIAAGNLALAARAYERANDIDKKNIGSQVRLAQVRLAAGETARAFSDLESLATEDSSRVQAEMTLYTEHLRRHEYDQALAAVDAIQKLQQNAALGPFLRGSVYFEKRDLTRAREFFAESLQAKPDFFPAGYNLALIDIQEGRPQGARERYEGMLAKDAKNEQLLLALAEVRRLTGGSMEDVRAILERAVAANPNSSRSRLALIAYLARHGDTKGAVAAAQTALTAIPNDPQLIEALGAAHLANGDANQAAEVFKRLVEVQPRNPLALLRLAEMQVIMKDFSAAITSERKALALNPDLSQAYVALARTYLVAGKVDDALGEARKLQKERPDKAIGYAFEGEVLASQKKWPEAAAALKLALSREVDPVLATRTYVLLQRAGKSADATTLAKKWTSEHPKDVAMPLVIGQEELASKNFGGARSKYEQVLKIDPDNAVALNNMAWILAEQKDPKALEYAEHAHRLAPFDPSVLDTLGWTLTQNGQAKRGAELLRMASALAPGHGEIRLHFAKALIESGDRAAARQELAPLSKLDKASPLRIEAERLLTSP